MPRRLRFNAVTMNCVVPFHHGQWVRPDSRQAEYNDMQMWVDLARLLERGRFDVLFLADVLGIKDSSPGLRDLCLREADMVPTNDPAAVVPVMAYATEHLGLAVTSAVIQVHPFVFARQLSTLDHLTNGRVSWNIVTSFLDSAARNLGWGGELPSSEERYAQAEEYLDVVYKLLEGSWEDDAVLRDRERRIYTDPEKVHAIDHVGQYYNVAGPHLCEPSPQRVPFLFQAGTSNPGREFASGNAEAMFMLQPSPEAARLLVDDVRARAVAHGRESGDVLFFQGMTFVVGGTEEEAQRKLRELDELATQESYIAPFAGTMGIDLEKYPLDTPLSELRLTSSSRLQALIDKAPDKNWKLADLLRGTLGQLRIVGAPEQVADALQEWADAGVDGFNIYMATIPGSFEDFIEGVTPVLQERGLQQRDYGPGTLREKLTDGASGPRLNSRHPAAAYRRTSWSVSK